MATPSIQNLVFRTQLVPLLVLGLVLGGWQARQNTQNVLDLLGKELLAIARTTALQIDGDQHERIQDQGTDFLEIRGRLRAIQQANELQTEIYTMRPRGSGVEFVVMTNDEPIMGDHYPLTDQIHKVLEGGQATSSGVYEDPHGTWISALAPIRNRGGRVVAVLEVDRSIGEVRGHQVMVLLAGGAVFAAALSIATVLARRQAQRVSRPIGELAAAVASVARGDLHISHHLPPSSSREVDTLAAGLQHMATSLLDREMERNCMLEKLLDADRLKDRMLSSLSHELRTPLTAVVAGAEILATSNEMSDADRTEFGAEIQKQGQKLQQLIDHAIDFAALGTRSTQALETVALGEIVASVLAGVRSLADSRGVRLEALGPWPNVRLDRTRTVRALQLVTDNAIRFSGHGGLVRIRWEHLNPASGQLLVEDNGPGVPEEERDAIFLPFHQGGDLMTGKPEGLGLGLSIARAAMRAQGGEVALLATQAVGSAFALTLGPTAILPWPLATIDTPLCTESVDSTSAVATALATQASLSPIASS